MMASRQMREAKPDRRVGAVVSIVAMVVAMLMGLGAQQAAAAPSCHPFPDVNSSNVHCENIEWLSGQGITKPADGLYHPTRSVNRGSMAAFLFRLTHPGKASPKCTSKPFPDVSTSNVFCGYIQWAVNNGVTKGYPSDGTYRPRNGVTRGAMAAFLQRIANPGHPAKACYTRPFDDVTTMETFCAVITWMVDNGITYGIGGGTNYGTKQIVNRQSMASFLHRLENLIDEGGTRSHPASYGDVFQFDGRSTKFNVTLNAPNWNADALIAAENMFNDPPRAGYQYVLLPVRVKNLIDEPLDPSFELTVKYVSSTGRSYSQAYVVEPDALSDVDDLYAGGEATGNIAFELPSNEIHGGQWALSAFLVDGEVYFAAE